MRGTRETAASRASMSSTGMPPLPAPTWKMWAIDFTTKDTEGTKRKRKLKSFSLGALCGSLLFRFRQRPLPRVVPDLVAGQPPPGGLDGEDAAEPGRVPAAGGP